MSGKALIIIIASAALLAGCATTPPSSPLPTEKQAPAVTSTDLPAPVATLRLKPAPRPPAAASAKPVSSKNLADHINGTVVQNGHNLTVTRGTPQPPVPLFRQAIVLATVRTTLNNSPAAPQASFQRGELHLRFDRGTNEQIATAINRVLNVSEVNRLHATIP